jgi:MFS transporter, UMF1 family
MFKNKKAIWGWAMYDWANSAFATTVMAGFFPIFFKQYWSYGADINLSTARLGFGNAIASLIVALLAPILGAVADKGALKKKFLTLFAYLGVLMTAALFTIQEGQWALAIFIYVMGVISFSGANVFYDSLLPGITDRNNVDWVSSLGYAMGYLGGGLLFLLNVLMTRMPQKFGLPDTAMAIRFAFILVAFWWGGFSILTILWVPERKTLPTVKKNKSLLWAGFVQFIDTLKKIRHLKTIFLFLMAYWFYIDGVDTLIRMAVDYGLSLGFAASDLIIALLIVQFVGFPAALLFGKLGQSWGVRKSIYLAICIYMAITVWGAMMSRPHEFYILAVVIGLVQGGIQALSRSYYSRLIPQNQSAEYYGFYNMLGKFAAIFGPALMGFTGLAARRILMPPSPTPLQAIQVGQLASRFSLASILILFLLGGILFYFVDEKKGQKEAASLSEI